MIITPNFDNAVEFTPIVAGTYTARLTSVSDVKQSQKSGDSYVNWTWTIYGAEGTYASANGKTVQGFTMLSGKGAGAFKSMLKALGVEPVTGQQLDTSELFGKEANIIVKAKKNEDGTLSDWVEVAAVRPITQ